MADLTKIVVSSVGYSGGPGYTTYYSNTVAAALAAIRAFYFSLRIYVPPTVTFKFPGTGYNIDPVTGHATGTWTSAAPSDVTGLGTGKYSAPSGYCLVWDTGAVNSKGHLIRGRSFLVPMAQDAFSADGTPDDTVRAAVLGYAETMRTAAPIRVWKRPWTKTSADGEEHAASAVRLSDRAAILRSRRA